MRPGTEFEQNIEQISQFNRQLWAVIMSSLTVNYANCNKMEVRRGPNTARNENGLEVLRLGNIVERILR